MKKIKLDAGEMEVEILRIFFRQINVASSVIPGLELEHLVLLAWHQKNYLKIQFEKVYKLSMQPHEALSLQRMLMRIGLKDAMAAIVRDNICEQIQQQLHPVYAQTNSLQHAN